MNLNSSLSSNNYTIDSSSRIYADKLIIEDNVNIGPNTIIVGDYVHIAKDTRIKENCDIRASRIHISEKSEISQNTKILVAEQFKIGVASRISHDVEITCRRLVAGNLLFLGHGLSVGYGGTYESTATVNIGNQVALGPHNIINANCPILLEDQVGSGCNLALWTHGYHFGHSILEGFNVSYGTIHIKKNVWLGFQVTVLPGVTIGENTIIAAGSVVTKDLPANCLAAGAPAIPKKELIARNISYEEQEEIIASILEKWREELEWKEIKSEIIRSGTNSTYEMIIYHPHNNRKTYVALWPYNMSGPPSMRMQEVDEAIFLSLPERSLDNLGNNQYTLFEINNRKISGTSTIISEDLRNYLRRHGIQCGEHNLFQSITPPAFERLLMRDK